MSLRNYGRSGHGVIYPKDVSRKLCHHGSYSTSSSIHNYGLHLLACSGWIEQSKVCALARRVKAMIVLSASPTGTLMAGRPAVESIEAYSAQPA